jgi:hypothetical protein
MRARGRLKSWRAKQDKESALLELVSCKLRAALRPSPEHPVGDHGAPRPTVTQELLFILMGRRPQDRAITLKCVIRLASALKVMMSTPLILIPSISFSNPAPRRCRCAIRR